MPKMTLDLRAKDKKDLADRLSGIALTLEDQSGKNTWKAAIEAHEDETTFRGRFDWYDDDGAWKFSAGGFADTDGEYGVSVHVSITFPSS